MTRRKLAQALAAAAVTLIAGYLVLSHLSLGDVATLARGFDLRFLVAGFLAYLGANCVRAFRFRVLVGDRISLLAFLRIVIIQNFLNTFFPFRAGEFSYLYMVHRTGEVTLGRNVGSLVGARALDFSMALVIPLLAGPWSRGFSAPGHPFGWLAGLLALMTLGFTLVVLRGKRLADALAAPPRASSGARARVVGLLTDVLYAVADLHENGLWTRVMLLTFTCWALIYTSGCLLLVGTGLTLRLPDALFAYGFPTLASMTPVYMLGGFGIYEGSVGTGLSLVGVPLKDAFAVGLLLHVAELLFVVVPAPVVMLFGPPLAPARSR